MVRRNLPISEPAGSGWRPDVGGIALLIVGQPEHVAPDLHFLAFLQLLLCSTLKAFPVRPTNDHDGEVDNIATVAPLVLQGRLVIAVRKLPGASELVPAPL